MLTNCLLKSKYIWQVCTAHISSLYNVNVPILIRFVVLFEMKRKTVSSTAIEVDTAMKCDVLRCGNILNDYEFANRSILRQIRLMTIIVKVMDYPIIQCKNSDRS